MSDIRSPQLLCMKVFLFVVLGSLAGGMLLAEHLTLRSATLLAVSIWAFCRAYYFAFYVLQHYIDPSFRYAGLWSALWFAGRRFFASSSGNPPENIR